MGKDEVIADVAPAYVTDALLRRVDVDRYDDREVIKTNLVESYEQLMEFGRKHLPDRFYLEEDQRKSLRNIITREMIANTLIHREYTSSYQEKFVIERERMYVENANRAAQAAILTPDNATPNPKNPIIADFFRNVGYADKLGSGVRNLFKYSRFYSGQDPEFIEGDVFKIIVPLNEELAGENVTLSDTQAYTQAYTQTNTDITSSILEFLKGHPTASQTIVAKEFGININTLKAMMRKLRQSGKIERVGTSQKGKWIVK